MRRRDFIIVLAGGVAAGKARAEELAKLARVGVLWQTPENNPSNEVREVLRQILAERGYIEGRNLIFEQRYADGHPDRLPKLTSELLSRGVDVIVAAGSPQALAAKRQTTAVPIVFISGDPVGIGLVTNLAHPGGNLTGVSALSGEYSQKWLGLLKEAEPRTHRVAVLWNPDNPSVAKEVEQIRLASQGLAIELAVFAGRANEIDASLAAIASANVDGLVITDDGYLVGLADKIGVFAAEHKLPTVAGFKLREGILMSYSYDQTAVGRRVADYVDRILKGARPADLPVEQVTDFTLRINPKDREGSWPHNPFLASRERR